MIHKLEWDSEFFGYPVGKAEFNDSTQFDSKSFIEETKKFKVVYCFSKIKIDHENLKLVDEKVVFHQNIPDRLIDSKPIDYEILSFDRTVHSYDQLKKLTLASGQYSRFSLDKNFNNNEFERLYLKWIEGSVNKSLAYDILIAVDRNNIIGFSTLAKKSATLTDIGLVAVDENYRGKGLASALMARSVENAKQNGFKEIQVVTQLNNEPAVRLYKKANFKIQDLTYIYHYWNHDTI